MTNKNRSTAVIEFGKIRPEGTGSGAPTGDCFISRKAFSYLRDIVIEENHYSDEIDKVFRYSKRKGEEAISARNYVGIIETRDGTIIEILPKIHFNHEFNDDQLLKEATKKIFIRMIACLKDSPFRNIDKAHINSMRFPLLEIFITAFISEFEILLKKGVNQSYQTKEENLNYFKSRLLITKNIKVNLVNRARFYVEYDEFQLDIPQNRILKSTLKYLQCKTVSVKNKSRLFNYLNILGEIPESSNYESDFSKITTQNRLFAHYQQILEWSKIFLLGNSFTTYKGKSLNRAILFPMEKIFEAYVSAGIQKFITSYNLNKQDRRYFLIDKHDGQSRFRLIPDNVLRSDKSILVLDTKWKIIDEKKVTKNYFIDSSDMYQMYAYGEKYLRKECICNKDMPKSIKLYLLYPRHANFTTPLKVFLFHDDTSSSLELNVLPVNLDGELRETIMQLNL